MTKHSDGDSKKDLVTATAFLRLIVSVLFTIFPSSVEMKPV